MKTKNLLLLLCLASFFASAQVINKKSNPVRVEVKEAVSQKPVITWITPAQATSTHNDRKLKVKVGIKSAAPLKDVTLFVNEKPVGAERGMGIGTGSSANFDKVIDREIDVTNGINELKLVAINENDEVATEYRTVNVTLQALASTARNDYALLIGTNDYDEWDDLTNPVFDVNTIAQELESRYSMKLNPTTGQIITKLREYGKKAYNPHDQLFIFIAGHGQFDEVFSDGYIVGKNSKLNDEAKESYISHTNLRTIIGSIPSNHIFLTMDVCFGGTFDRAVAKRGADDDAMYADIETDEFVERKLRHKTRLYVTSGGKNYVKDGRAGAHSPFARKFIEALRTYGGRDKVLTTQDIWVYLETLPMEPHRGEFEGNEPGSDFVFVAK
jgi:hypothetical protein